MIAGNIHRFLQFLVSEVFYRTDYSKNFSENFSGIFFQERCPGPLMKNIPANLTSGHRKTTPRSPPFFEFTPSPIRTRSVLRCTTFPERGPVRAPIGIRQPPDRSKTPGYFCTPGGPEVQATTENLILRRRPAGKRACRIPFLRRKLITCARRGYPVILCPISRSDDPNPV